MSGGAGGDGPAWTPPSSPRTPDEDALRQRVKHELRRRMKAVRGALPAAARKERSAKLAERLLALPELSGGPLVAAFVPIRGEVDLAPFLEGHRARGGTVALPRVDLEAQEVVLHLHEAGAELAQGAFGIPEPSPAAPRVPRPDVVLVPGLAIDPRGHRVGYGKGFYDRLLPELEGALRVAVAFDFQLVAEVPAASFDEPVDLVVTDARVLRVER
ncbi:MAG: 5-formyltetrahydrofolate cyclo-ligase [Myxococcota bacterium]